MRDRTKNPQECPRLWRLGLGSAEDLVLSKNGSSLDVAGIAPSTVFRKGGSCCNIQASDRGNKIRKANASYKPFSAAGRW